MKQRTITSVLIAIFVRILDKNYLIMRISSWLSDSKIKN